MARLANHFIIPMYKLIFEQDPPCMFEEVMEAILNIVNWYASRSGTLIRVFGREKPMHVLPTCTMDKLVMQEAAYHLSTGLSAGLHRKKKSPWTTLPLRIGLYEIKSLKDVDANAKEIVKFEFDTKDFNLYDRCGIYKNHCVKVYYPWIHRTCDWAEEDP